MKLKATVKLGNQTTFNNNQIMSDDKNIWVAVFLSHSLLKNVFKNWNLPEFAGTESVQEQLIDNSVQSFLHKPYSCQSN